MLFNQGERVIVERERMSPQLTLSHTFEVTRGGRDSIAELAGAVVGEVVDFSDGGGFAGRWIISPENPNENADASAAQNDRLPKPERKKDEPV